MPFTFNGFGTKFYGNRDVAEDGSYVTTEWITALYVPLVPLRSYRVRLVGQGTNVVVHRSQSYQTVRVPLCWPQVRNVYLCASPVLVLILYFGGPDIRNWWNEDVMKKSAPRVSLKPEPQQEQTHVSDTPLDSKAAVTACGKVMKLDKASFAKLNLMPRFSQRAADSGLKGAEFKEMYSENDVTEQEFEAYGFGYLTWEKSTEVSRADFDKMIMKVVHSVDQKSLSAVERERLEAYLVKFKSMMLKAFDLGRHDARISPCQL